MAKTDYQSIDEYHRAFPADVVKRLQEIRKTIHEVVPEAEEVISYQIPCFKYSGYLIYYAAFTNHISLSYPYSKALLEHFKGELKNYKRSKSAIQFPHSEKLPLKLIRGIVAFRKKENALLPKKK